ncbi:MAG: hypothetical protein WB424_00745 [Terracidiphilus sp.]
MPCVVKGLYDVSVLLEHYREEKRKHQYLFRLRWALRHASPWLKGVDTSVIHQVIDAALQSPYGTVQDDNKEKNNAS